MAQTSSVINATDGKVEGSYGGSYSAGLGATELKMPYLSVGSPYGLEEAEAILKAIQGESLTMGKYISEFQNTFAEYTGVRRAIFVSNCTRAMEMAADAIGIGEGDESHNPGDHLRRDGSAGASA